MTRISKAVQLAAGWPGLGAPSGAHRRLSAIMRRAEYVVLAYYAASLYLASKLMVQINQLGRLDPDWDLLWPLAWLEGRDVAFVAELFALLAMLAALGSITLRQYMLPRIVFAVSFFLAASSLNSTGGINHPYHAWVWVAFIFACLPAGRSEAMSRAARLSYVTTFLAAQVLFMLFYTMAGLWKVILGLKALALGQPGNFSFEALSWTIADRSMQTGTEPLLSELIIYYPTLAWPAFLAVMYVQVFAVLGAMRPSLTVFFGYALIAFHLGTWLMMEIIFTQHVLLLALLMVMTPFSETPFNLRAMLRDMPLVSLLRFGRDRHALERQL